MSKKRLIFISPPRRHAHDEHKSQLRLLLSEFLLGEVDFDEFSQKVHTLFDVSIEDAVIGNNLNNFLVEKRGFLSLARKRFKK